MSDVSGANLGIRTPRVMISSTVEDLVDIRARAHKVCEDLGLEIQSMDDNIAVAKSARGFSIDLVDGSDVYVGIVAQSAGSKPVGDELNYTALEYERARYKKISRLLFLSKVDDDAQLDERVAALRKRMLNDEDNVRASFKDSDDFEKLLRDSLTEFTESWRQARGLNPDQVEFVVEPLFVQEGETVDVSVSCSDEVLRQMTASFAGQPIQLDDEGRGSASATVQGTHKVELVFGPEDDQRVLHEPIVTVVERAGFLRALAILGAFIGLAVWYLAGFSHPRALEPPSGYSKTLDFGADWIGHIVTLGALIAAVLLGAVFGRFRRSLGEIISLADQQWLSIRWWATALVIAIMSVATYMNVTYILGNTETWWWSQDAGRWVPWLIAAAYFMLALTPILLLIVRLGLALGTAMQEPTKVLTYDPASNDGHFGLAWLGNTMFCFLAIASVPLSIAAAVQISKHDTPGLGIPIAILLAIVVIGLIGVFPLLGAYPRLESQRQRALDAVNRKVRRLEDMRDDVLTERERKHRSNEIAAAAKRTRLIENASPLVMGRFGWWCVGVISLSVIVPLFFLITRN